MLPLWIHAPGVQLHIAHALEGRWHRRTGYCHQRFTLGALAVVPIDDVSLRTARRRRSERDGCEDACVPDKWRHSSLQRIPVPIALGTLGRHMQTHRTHKGTGPALGPPVGPRQPPRGSARKEDMLAGSAGRPRTRLAGGRTRIKAWPLMLTPRTECSRMKPRELNLYSDTPSSASTLCGRPGARRGAQRSVQRTATVCVSRGHMRSTSTCGRAQP